MQDQRQESKSSTTRLALQFSIEKKELQALCNRFQTAIAKGEQNGYSTGMIAVKLTRVIKEAIDLKFEKKEISAEHLVLAHDSNEPPFNKFKASIVRGMFLTFIEHPRGFPGLFDIFAGIAAAGLGYGSFTLPGTDKKIKLSAIRSLCPEEVWLRTTQIELLKRLLTPERLGRFASARIGLYSLLVGASLLPFYAAALGATDRQVSPPEPEKAIHMVLERFSADSEHLSKFLNQNLFVVLFEELFAHESTVFSVFKL